VDDAEQEQQDDDQARHAENPEQKGNHRRLLSAGNDAAWPAILDGRDAAFRVGRPADAQPEAYCRQVA
jgi:hypothetical protein